MARVIKLDDEAGMKSLTETLYRAVQSSHLALLLGAGASLPGVQAAGDIEKKIMEKLKADDIAAADKLAITFLKGFADPMRALIDGSAQGNVEKSLQQYTELIRSLDRVLAARHSSLLPKQATIFTTNYDLFVESAAESCPSVILNDGFKRTATLSGKHYLRTETFFDSTRHTSQNYEYTSEVPSINLVKLHGSMSWSRADDAITYELLNFDALKLIPPTDAAAIRSFIDELAIIVPTKAKFRQTVVDRTYYDLLRIYANFLDRENVVMLAFGFSFADEHIAEITLRALRNPTLQLVICCYRPAEVQPMLNGFADHNNVVVLEAAHEGDLNFDWFNKFLGGSVLGGGGSGNPAV